MAEVDRVCLRGALAPDADIFYEIIGPVNGGNYSTLRSWDSIYKPDGTRTDTPPTESKQNGSAEDVAKGIIANDKKVGIDTRRVPCDKTFYEGPAPGVGA